MTRDDHLAYCKICKKSYLDRKQGLLCSLTSKKADFQNKCPEFDIDSDHLNTMTEKVVERYKQKNKENKSLYKRLNGPQSFYYFIDTDRYVEDKDLPEAIMYRNSGMKDLTYAVVSSAITLIVAFQFDLQSFLDLFNESIPAKIGVVVLIFSVGYGLSRWRNVFDKEVKLALSRSGLITKKHGLITWNNIYLTVVFDHKDKEGKSELILHLISNVKENPAIVELTHMDTCYEEIALQLGKYLKAYRTNF